MQHIVTARYCNTKSKKDKFPFMITWNADEKYILKHFEQMKICNMVFTDYISDEEWAF